MKGLDIVGLLLGASSIFAIGYVAVLFVRHLW
jgi:hypothetical protein